MWTPWYTAAFVLGILQIIVCIFSYLFNNRAVTLIIRITFDILAIVGGICILEYSHDKALLAVIVVDAIQMVRDIVFLMRDKYKWADHLFWVFFFEVIFWLSLIFTWAGPISLLPTFGGAIVGVALYLKNQKTVKMISIWGEICFIIYYALLISSTDLLTILSMIVSCTFFASCIVGLTRIFIKEHREKKAQIKQEN